MILTKDMVNNSYDISQTSLVSLLALNVKKGDAVFCPTFTFFATAIDELRLAGSLRHTEEKYERLQADMVLSQQLCDVIMESARGGGVEVNMP